MPEQTLVPCFASRFSFYRIDIQDDANTHKVISYKYLSNSICTVVEEFCQSDLCLWRFFFSAYLYLVSLMAQRVEQLSVSVLVHDHHSHAALVSLGTLAFFFPLVTSTFSSFDAN